MIYPSSQRDILKFKTFLHVLCLSIKGDPSGFHGTAHDMDTGHCHTAVAKFIATRGQQHLDDKVVILGIPSGYYEIAHSLVVNKEETAILTDTYSGEFANGEYVTHANRKYQVYAAYSVGDLLHLSAHLDTFDAALNKLRMVKFEGLNIPRKGVVTVSLAKPIS